MDGKGKLDITGDEDTVAKDTRDFLKTLIAVRTLGGDAESVTEAAIATSNVSGRTMVEEMEELIALSSASGKPINELAQGIGEIVEVAGASMDPSQTFGAVAAAQSVGLEASAIKEALAAVLAKRARFEELTDEEKAKMSPEKLDAMRVPENIFEALGEQFRASGKLDASRAGEFVALSGEFSEGVDDSTEKGAVARLLELSSNAQTAGDKLSNLGEDAVKATEGLSLWDAALGAALGPINGFIYGVTRFTQELGEIVLSDSASSAAESQANTEALLNGILEELAGERGMTLQDTMEALVRNSETDAAPDVILCRTHAVCAHVARELGDVAVHVRPDPTRSLDHPSDRFAVGPGQILVASIHSFKGREADRVALVSTPRWRREWTEGEEARVRYVGASRARRLLVEVELEAAVEWSA